MFDASTRKSVLRLLGAFAFVFFSTQKILAEEPVSPVNPPTKDERSEKMKSRLEQLFTWRVSDRLQLNPDEEARFTEAFKKLSDEKSRLAQEQDEILKKIEQEKDNGKMINKLLNDYRASVKKSIDPQLDELQVMKKLFGNKRLVEYVLLKREMTRKFKDVLTQNGFNPAKVAAAAASPKPPLKDPEVIQEK